MPNLSMTDDQCRWLAKQIMALLKQGLTADKKIDTFLASTFSNPSIDKVKQVVSTHSHVERDSLVDLLLFPDESFQAALEPYLTGRQLSSVDVQTIIHILADSDPSIIVHLPALKGHLHLRPTCSEWTRAIGRLNMTWLAPEPLIRAIESNFSKQTQVLVSVWLRNADLKINDSVTQSLCDFLNIYNDTAPDFSNYFHFFIDFLNQKPCEPFFAALVKEKNRMVGGLRQAARFEAVAREANMETLMLSGVRPPADSSDYFRRKIALIDDIIQALYSRDQV